MDPHLAQELGVPLKPRSAPLPVIALDGRPLGLGTITHCTIPLHLHVAGKPRDYSVLYSLSSLLVLSHSDGSVANKPVQRVGSFK